MKTIQKLLWAIALVGFIAGCYGLYDRFVSGHTNVAYGSTVPWGLWVAAYSYLMGISGGAFILSALVTIFGINRLARVARLGLFAALAALVAALLSIVIDLGHPERALRLFTSTNLGSVMGAMGWIYLAYGLLLAVMLWFALRVDFAAASTQKGFKGALAKFLLFGQRDSSPPAISRDRRVLQSLGAIGIVLAVAFLGGGGALFGVVAARPFWNAGLLPILFIAGALLSGAGLLACVALVFDNDSTRQGRDGLALFGRIILGLLALYVIIEWAEYSVGLYSAVPAEANAFRLVLFGPYAWVFWGIHVLLGIGIPALILLFRKSPLAIGIAGTLVALTFISVRLNVIIPGQVIPVMPGLAEAFTGPGLVPAYAPTLTEWLVLTWIVSTGLLVFLLGYMWLPLGPNEAIESKAPAPAVGAAAPASE